MASTVSGSRSALMSRIRSTNTAPELILRRGLTLAGHHYRVHVRTLVGRPDVVFPGRHVAVFVDGCFWHGCPDHYVRPRGTSPFWPKKLAENVTRDRRQTLALEAVGWRVIRFWEHEVFERLDRVVARVEQALDGRRPRRALSWRVVRVEPINEDGSRECRVLEDLRDAARRRVVDQARSTKKWRRPGELGGRRAAVPRTTVR